MLALVKPGNGGLVKKLGAAGLVIALTACTTPYGEVGPKTGLGAAAGAAAGGLLAATTGGHEAAIASGVLIGGLLGGALGSALDAQDRKIAARTAQQSLEYRPTGYTSDWRNPDTGHYGSFTPVRTYQEGGTYCREYQQTIYVGGHPQQGHGTACREPDGTWRIQ